MKSYKEVCDYLVGNSVIDDVVYDFITDGKKWQLEINKIIYNNGNLNGSNNNDMIIERILLPRIMTIKRQIKELIVNCGYDVGKLTALSDMVEYIIVKDIASDKKNEISKLYQEFVIIRNGIWNYYLYILNDILIKYIDDSKYDDIYQEAGIALMSAIEKYGKGNYNFKGFVNYYIMYSINYHYHDLDLYLNVPVNKRHLYYKMHKTIEYYVAKYHKMPTKKDLMKFLKITSKMLATFLGLSMTEFVSLNDSICNEDGYIRNEEVFSLDNDIRKVENMAIGEDLCGILSQALEELTERERIVIYEYYLREDNLDFGEITKKLGVSYGTTMNLRRRALIKLRCHKDELGKYLR